MTDYTKLAKALRHCSHDGLVKCNECKYGGKEWPVGCEDEMMRDAAAAIEELQQIAAHYEQSAKDWWKEAREYKIKSAEGITAEESKELIKRFKSIPCGPIEPLPKRGEWIRHPEVKNIYGGEVIECPFCGEKYVVQYIADEKFCRNCGADMRKMEVQDGK